MYDLPEFKYRENFAKILKHKMFSVFLLLTIIAVASGFIIGAVFVRDLQDQVHQLFQKVETESINEELLPERYVSRIPYEQAIIDAVKIAFPSVVSIIISKDLPVYEQRMINPFQDVSDLELELQFPQYVQRGTEKRQVGAGSGFIVSEDGLVLTNKHVVIDESAEYTVLTNDGNRYSAKVLALDPFQDLAIIKIESDESFLPMQLGDSDGIEIGQGAIIIGNALGEFRNTVSVGVISGLGRTISAFGTEGFSQVLEDVIQTDAAINMGNSGGPLLNLRGEVVGVSTAMAEGAQTIGFAIPINVAKRGINQVIATGRIVYPFLGVRYVLINNEVQDEYNLSVNYGALIISGEREPAITPGSAAQEVGLRENDIILEMNDEKITTDNSLAKIIRKYNPGDVVILKIMRLGQEMEVEVILGERD